MIAQLKCATCTACTLNARIFVEPKWKHEIREFREEFPGCNLFQQSVSVPEWRCRNKVSLHVKEVESRRMCKNPQARPVHMSRFCAFFCCWCCQIFANFYFSFSCVKMLKWKVMMLAPFTSLRLWFCTDATSQSVVVGWLATPALRLRRRGRDGRVPSLLHEQTIHHWKMQICQSHEMRVPITTLRRASLITVNIVVFKK